MDHEDKIIIDLDDTITIDSSSKEYESKLPNLSIRKALQNISKRLIPITIFSARNMNSYKKDLDKINKITRPIVENWLKENSIDYSELILGKPWAGKNGWYVDDRNLSLDEFIFKFSGPFANNNFDIVITCFNEEDNINYIYQQSKKLEKLLDVNSYIFVNNGSEDGTKRVLDELQRMDKKIKIISLEKNLGYGGGIKKGLENVSSEFVLLNHADGQFDAYSFLSSNVEDIPSAVDSIMPQRLNRPFIESLSSSVLRLILSLLKLRKIQDFNGQPKIFRTSKINNISELPNDFCIDYSLFRIFEKESLLLPVLQRDRKLGNSSWKDKYLNWVVIFCRYIAHALFFDKNKFRK
jgi:capsule biosynthesis phosphatase